MKKRLVFIVAVVCLVAASSLFAKKQISDVQQEILERKLTGQEVGGDLWHAADNAHRLQREEAMRLREAGFNGLDDGGETWQSATAITSNPYEDAGTTIGKGSEGLIPSCLTDGSDTAEDAWYLLMTTDSIVITVWTTCADNGPPSYDTRLGIFDDMQMLLACNDDSPDCGAPHYQSLIEDVALSPGNYYICVDGYDGDAGPYIINVEWEVGSPCVGSDMETAEIISSLPFTDTGSTIDECDDVEIACELGGENEAADYWYKLTLTSDVYLDIQTTCSNSWFDTKLALMDENGTQLTCNDDDPFCESHQSHIEDYPLSPGIYYIVVDGWRDSEGAYQINVTSSPYDPSEVSEWRPDILIRENDLYDNQVVTNVEPGRTHLVLSNGTPNDGDGPIYLYGVFPPESDSTQDVRQRIYRSDGSFYDHESGQFVFHPEHDHIHLADWCIYRLREVLPDSGVGAIVAEGEKTSFCIIDLAIFNPDNRHYDEDGQFHSCSSTIQGISAGWVDIYDRSLPGQWIDVTDIPEGQYWLEAEADPDNHILEVSEDNNIGRVLVVIGAPPGLFPDDFEPNNTRLIVDGRPVGGSNSPNLGPCGPERTIDSLTIHDENDDDYYKFYSNHAGTAADFVRINFAGAEGDLDMGLLNAAGNEVGASEGTGDVEQISMASRAEGWYYVHVYGYNGATSSNYSLTINPPSNQSATVSVLNPPVGNINLIHGQDTYTATWNSFDPENDERWVTMYMNTVAELNGDEVLLPTSLNTPAQTGFHIINSAYFPVGTYWVYCSITDGGTVTGNWSQGTLTFLEQVDADPSAPVAYQFNLSQNYPNPFNPSTTINFSIGRNGFVKLQVYDILGRQVSDLIHQELPVGQYSVPFSGSNLSSGLYFYTLSSSEGVKTEKMMLLK